MNQICANKKMRNKKTEIAVWLRFRYQHAKQFIDCDDKIDILYPMKNILTKLYGEPITYKEDINVKLIWVLSESFSRENNLLVIIRSIQIEEVRPYVGMMINFYDKIPICNIINNVIYIKKSLVYIQGDSELECLLIIATLFEINILENQKEIDETIHNMNLELINIKKTVHLLTYEQYIEYRIEILKRIGYNNKFCNTGKNEKKFTNSSALCKYRLYNK